MHGRGALPAGPEGSTASLDLHGTGPRALTEVRRWIGATLTILNRVHLQDVIQIADELTSNAYEHADGACAIRVTHRPASGSVLIEVEDDNSATPTLGHSRHGPNAHRGRGMVLVDQLARTWGVRRPAFGRTTKTVWAEIPCTERAEERTPR